MDIFGEEYISQYVLQTIKKDNKKLLLETYITDALNLIAKNTAKFAGGSYMNKRYFDMVREDNKREPEETGDEIIARISEGLDKISRQGGE